ncbi:YafY family protein [Marinimicrobium sp. ABcell2]|uniref:helix-turn-helix transcriptional regulator n=1 Tax=Marinimicrobium sp. ABcell2 TaxID=3069751 RepID=UPI0027B47A39|nr:YafY family protein [Marinimicrobium sp. ABcell2]MDQ2076900.1 YafY family protein [Marinimicrobium sp. ABcell2]
MRKSDRLFQLTNLIRSRQPLFARTLAEELGVSVRTIYRYIDDLSVAGVPVYFDEGLGYRLVEGYELPPLAVTQDEFDALVTGVKLVQSWTGARLSDAAASLLHKMQAAAKDRKLDLLFDNVASPVLAERQAEASYWDTIRDAIRLQKTLTLSYADNNQRRSERDIFPLNLSFWGNKWTVGSWCHLRQDYRDFRLDRIAHLTVHQAPPPLPAHVSLAAYVRAVTKKEDALIEP